MNTDRLLSQINTSMTIEGYKVLIAASLGVAAGLSACEVAGITDFIPDSTSKNPISTDFDPTLTPGMTTEAPFVTPISTEVSIVGYGGQLTAEQQAFTETQRAQRMKIGLENYVNYWEEFRIFADGTQLSLIPYPDQSDPTNINKMVYVAEVSGDLNYDGFVITIPIAQYQKYLETGDPQVMLPPQNATTLMENTDPFKMTKQVKEGSIPNLAGIPIGAVNGVMNGEFVYFAPGTTGALEVVGKLDENFQWEVERPIKEFPICTPENFRDCEISVEELFDGTYFHWLQTLSKPFDQSKIKDVPLVMLEDGMIVYDWETAPNFEDPLTAPFRRDVTLGIVFLEIERVQYPYVVKPIEFFDKNEPQKNKWVITVRPFGDVKRGFWGEEDMDSWVRLWQEEMDTTPIMTSAFLYADYPDESLKNLEDPFVKRTFDNNPDMETRFDRFMAGEVGALSEPGIVLLMGYILIIPD